MANKKIQMQDSKGNIIYPATVSELVTYGSGNVNDTLIDLESRDELFISDTAPDKDGLWVDTSDQNSSPNGENIVATQIKKYIDEKITSKVDDCVEKVDEMEKDILSTNFNHIVTNQYSTALTDTKNGFANHEIIEGNTLQNYFVISNKTVTNENVGGERFTFYQKLQQQAVQVDGVYTLVNLSDKKLVVSKFNISTTAWDCEITLNPSEKKVINMGTISRFNAMFGRVEEGWTQDNCHLLPTSVLLLKGDWSDKEVPTYFKGLSCVGESEPISISAMGKNICPPLELGSISNSTGVDMPNDNLMRSKFIRVKPNTEYVCSNDGVARSVNLYSFDKEKRLLKFDQPNDSNERNVKFITDSNTHYIRVTMGMNNFDKFQVEESSVCSEYEPYREEVQLIHEPLRAIGDIKDIIDVNRGVIIRRIGKVLLDGSSDEDWVKQATSSSTTSIFGVMYRSININNIKIDPNDVWRKNVSCDLFRGEITSDIYNNVQDEHRGMFGLAGQSCNFVTDILTLDEWKTWVSKNPITVLYELETPIEEKINIAPLRLFEEARSVELVSNIKPTVTFDYPTNFKGIVESNINAINKLYDERTIVSNPNFLINGGFRVNQRGKSEYTDSGKYSVDRWQFNTSSGGSLAVKDDYISLTNKNDQNTYLRYYFEDDDAKFLDGKTVTVSVLYRSTETFRVKLGRLDGILLPPTQDWTLKTHTINLSSWRYTNRHDDSSLILQAYNNSKYTNGTLDVKWIKLELGDKPTPYIPRNYAEELRDCQRYYVEYNSYNAWLSMNVTHGNYFEILIPTPTTMRKTPTIIKNVNGAIQYYSSSGWADIPAISYALGCGFIRGAGKFTDETSHRNYLVKWIPSFDAEIY